MSWYFDLLILQSQVTSYIVIGADSLVFPLTLAHIPNHIKDQTTCLSCPLLSWFQDDDICYVINLDALSNLGWWHLLCQWFGLPVWSWTIDWVLTIKPVMFEFDTTIILFIHNIIMRICGRFLWNQAENPLFFKKAYKLRMTNKQTIKPYWSCICIGYRFSIFCYMFYVNLVFYVNWG